MTEEEQREDGEDHKEEGRVEGGGIAVFFTANLQELRVELVED